MSRPGWGRAPERAGVRRNFGKCSVTISKSAFNRGGNGMLVKTLKVIATLATAVTLFGCSGTRSTPAAPTVARSEQKTLIRDERASSGVKQTQQTETQQTQAAAYRPCIQGPETLRLLDRHSAEKRNFEGDEVTQLVDRLPPLTRQRLRRLLEELATEADTKAATKQDQVVVTGNYGPSLYADIAEEYIADCSDQLARLSAVAVISDMWPAEAVVRLWQSNLDFMKWWLANHRQKSGNIR